MIKKICASHKNGSYKYMNTPFHTSKICIIYSGIFSILRFPKAKGFLFITLLLWSLKKGKTMVIFQNGFANFLRVFSSLACVQQGKLYTQHVCLTRVFSQIKSIAHTHLVCMCVCMGVCAYLSIFQISYISCCYGLEGVWHINLTYYWKCHLQQSFDDSV